jgi:aryl-alcohol dehydrogenase-like predicted oxidoreductase
VEYRHLGSSGLEVSVLGLGGNMFGGYVDEATTKAILHRAIDLGVNFFDNAKTYAGGASEELMGKALTAAPPAST